MLMTVQIYGENAQLVLDLTGVFFFAVTGALTAARKDFDLVASFLLAAMTGLGGGVIRDLLIGATPPAAVQQPLYLIPPILATVVVYAFYPHVVRFRRTLLTFDAGGLGLFCVTGTVKALSFGIGAGAAVGLGVTSAVGGGLLRDVVARDVPSLFRPDDIYALPAVVGATMTTLLWSAGALSAITGVAASVVTFGLRALSLRYGWRIPLAAKAGGSAG